jgi:hypothetical protein
LGSDAKINGLELSTELFEIANRRFGVDRDAKKLDLADRPIGAAAGRKLPC